MTEIRREQYAHDNDGKARQRIFPDRRCRSCGKQLLGNEAVPFRFDGDDRLCGQCLDRRDRLAWRHDERWG